MILTKQNQCLRNDKTGLYSTPDWSSVVHYQKTEIGNLYTCMRCVLQEVCYHSSLDGSITIHMCSITVSSKGTGLPTAIKLDLFILGEIYEALSATNQMETKKPFLHPHSALTRENIHLFLRWCSHCNLYYILINCGLCWAALSGNCKSDPGWATTKFSMGLTNAAFNTLTTVCR